MKRKMTVVILVAAMVLAMVWVVNAQSAPTMSGPLNFNISVTEESEIYDKFGNDTNTRKLVTQAVKFTGSIFVDPNTGTDFPDITLEGMAADGTTVVIECLNENMLAISGKANNATKNVSDKFTLMAYCSFTSEDNEGFISNGNAFLNLSGTMTRLKGSTDDFPSKITLSGSTINGGGSNADGGSFVFKGTFSSVLVEPQ
jgi:hypothetical protein